MSEGDKNMNKFEQMVLKDIRQKEAELNVMKENLEEMEAIVKENKLIVELQGKMLNMLPDEMKTEEMLKDYEENKKIQKDMEEKYANVKATVETNEAVLNLFKAMANYDELKEKYLDEAVEELMNRDKNIC